MIGPVSTAAMAQRQALPARIEALLALAVEARALAPLAVGGLREDLSLLVRQASGLASLLRQMPAGPLPADLAVPLPELQRLLRQMVALRGPETTPRALQDLAPPLRALQPRLRAELEFIETRRPVSANLRADPARDRVALDLAMPVAPQGYLPGQGQAALRQQAEWAAQMTIAGALPPQGRHGAAAPRRAAPPRAALPAARLSVALRPFVPGIILSVVILLLAGWFLG